MKSKDAQSSRQVAEAILKDTAARTKLANYARSRFGLKAEEADELLQETAFELVRHENQIHDPEAFVFAVFRTRCTHAIRSDRRRRRMLPDRSILTKGSADERFEVDAQILLREAFGYLSPKCRKLLAARYLEGRTLEEAARLLSLKFLSVRKTLSRCLTRLRRYLA